MGIKDIILTFPRVNRKQSYSERSMLGKIQRVAINKYKVPEPDLLGGFLTIPLEDRYITQSVAQLPNIVVCY